MPGRARSRSTGLWDRGRYCGDRVGHRQVSGGAIAPREARRTVCGVHGARAADQSCSRVDETSPEKGATIDKPMSHLDFKVIAFGFRTRDIFRPRIDVLREVGIRSGPHVLDYGRGPGGYIPPLAELVDPSGQIYALDMSPAAIEATQRVVVGKKVKNASTIVSDCSTGLPEESVDAVLLYDAFHDLAQPNDVLRELHRVLKPDGVLSSSDHHMEEQDIIAGVTGSGIFDLKREGERTYSFAKVGATGTREDPELVNQPAMTDAAQVGSMGESRIDGLGIVPKE